MGIPQGVSLPGRVPLAPTIPLIVGARDVERGAGDSLPGVGGGVPHLPPKSGGEGG